MRTQRWSAVTINRSSCSLFWMKWTQQSDIASTLCWAHNHPDASSQSHTAAPFTISCAGTTLWQLPHALSFHLFFCPISLLLLGLPAQRLAGWTPPASHAALLSLKDACSGSFISIRQSWETVWADWAEQWNKPVISIRSKIKEWLVAWTYIPIICAEWLLYIIARFSECFYLSW